MPVHRCVAIDEKGFGVVPQLDGIQPLSDRGTSGKTELGSHSPRACQASSTVEHAQKSGTVWDVRGTVGGQQAFLTTVHSNAAGFDSLNSKISFASLNCSCEHLSANHIIIHVRQSRRDENEAFFLGAVMSAAGDVISTAASEDKRDPGGCWPADLTYASLRVAKQKAITKSVPQCFTLSSCCKCHQAVLSCPEGCLSLTPNQLCGCSPYFLNVMVPVTAGAGTSRFQGHACTDKHSGKLLSPPWDLKRPCMTYVTEQMK
ncbi:hypothetical protein U0070_014153 [Myodes glareolus]|uniref:Uncharacterized protein n=1 Tax=Myodes glareolus TaxID=447135 RepID=A0AAW0JE63_MYOGA